MKGIKSCLSKPTLFQLKEEQDLSISWKTGCMTLFISNIIKVPDSVFFSLLSRSSLWHSEVLYPKKEP